MDDFPGLVPKQEFAVLFAAVESTTLGLSFDALMIGSPATRIENGESACGRQPGPVVTRTKTHADLHFPRFVALEV